VGAAGEEEGMGIAAEEIKAIVGPEMLQRLTEHFMHGRLSLGDLGHFAPAELDNLHRVGQMFITRGQYDDAADVLRMLVFLNQSRADYWTSLGVALQMKRDFIMALAAYTTAQSIAPQLLAPRVYGAECNLQLQRPLVAKELLAVALKLPARTKEERELLDRAKRLRTQANSMKSGEHDLESTKTTKAKKA
jgi:tetratricopeptide (TPR) repeat protein